MTPQAVRRFRDLTLIDGAGGETTVIACDSVGGIGPKPGDTFRTEARTVTHFAARVPLLEVIAVGAAPVVIVDTLSVERDPSGQPMIDEIRDMAADIGLDPDIAVTGSTEDNVATTSTALGVTVIGIAEPGRLRLGGAQPDDHIYAIGVPLSAPEVKLTPGDARMPSIREVQQIAALAAVHEILPVGSKGIGYELTQMGTSLLVEPAGPRRIDRDTTAGPSTVILVAAPADGEPNLHLRPDLPIELVATIAESRTTERPS